ncbi:MAG: PspC domain-containing protein, partial [Chloroflexota bacterium]
MRRLYRTRTGRIVGGVCGGLGEFFGIDPTLIRLLFVFGVLLGWG